VQISNIKKEGDRLYFTVTDITPQMANALRRTIISDTPVMAIESVLFYDNSSILNDEVLAHRLGLLPLKTDLKTYNLVSECTCKQKGCGKCTAVLTLDVEGPKTVYASDLKPKDPEVTPVYPKTPLVKLTEGQKVKLEAKAILGRGSDHIKWQAGLASYEEKKDAYHFMIESYGQLPVKELVSIAFDSFEEKIKTIKEQLK
jgi:DNA-directed RNA polymerase subunit D